MPVELTIQGRKVLIEAPVSMGTLRDLHRPGADILIADGAVVDASHVPQAGSEITFIRRGEMPSMQELEACMMSRHTPGVHAVLKRSAVGIAGLGGLGS